MANRIVLNTISYHATGPSRTSSRSSRAGASKKVFLTVGSSGLKRGSAKVAALLDAAGIPYEVFSDIKPNPTIENVQSGVAAFKASGADCIVAVGGGSVMDTAKAIGIIINNPEFADVRSLEAWRRRSSTLCSR